MKKLMLASAVIGIMGASNAWADCDSGEQGGISAISGCDTVISLDVAEAVIVKNLDDISLTDNYTRGGSAPTEDFDAFCLGTNDVIGARITFTSENDFALVGQQLATDIIDYTVVFNDGASDTTVSSGTGINVARAQTDTLACNNTDQKITLSVVTADIDSSAAQAYADTITVTVAPR
jgi:hypothetical protein